MARSITKYEYWLETEANRRQIRQINKIIRKRIFARFAASRIKNESRDNLTAYDNVYFYFLFFMFLFAHDGWIHSCMDSSVFSFSLAVFSQNYVFNSFIGGKVKVIFSQVFLVSLLLASMPSLRMSFNMCLLFRACGFKDLNKLWPSFVSPLLLGAFLFRTCVVTKELVAKLNPRPCCTSFLHFCRVVRRHLCVCVCVFWGGKWA